MILILVEIVLLLVGTVSVGGNTGNGRQLRRRLTPVSAASIEHPLGLFLYHRWR